jgi:hypothetical protein
MEDTPPIISILRNNKEKPKRAKEPGDWVGKRR